MRAFLAHLALALSASAAIPLAAQDAPQWHPVNAETGQVRDVEGLAALAAAFPHSGSVRLRLFQAQLAAGDMDAVLESLAWLNRRQYSFSNAAREQIPLLVGEPYATKARELIEPLPLVIGNSEVIAQVPAEAGLIESVFAASDDGILVATSVTGNSIHVFEPGSGWNAIPIAGANDLSGIVSEPDNSVRWVASANLDGSEDREPLMTGLLGFGSAFEAPVFVHAPPDAAISDISIGPDGTVFASDPIGGGIYRKQPGPDSSLSAMIAPGIFRSPQGSAVSRDGTKLYVSDYRYGLAFVDLETMTVSVVASDLPVLLDGIDGMWLHEGELIAVQNGASPMRISAFRLSPDGTKIIGHRILEQAHPEWTEPLGGSIAGDALIYVGTGQWDRYEKGELRSGAQAIPTQIRRLPLTPAAG